MVVDYLEQTRKEGRTKDEMKEENLIGGFRSVARLSRAPYHSFVEKHERRVVCGGGRGVE